MCVHIPVRKNEEFFRSSTFTLHSSVFTVHCFFIVAIKICTHCTHDKINSTALLMVKLILDIMNDPGSKDIESVYLSYGLHPLSKLQSTIV